MVAELARGVKQLRETMDKCIRKVTGRKSMLQVLSKGIGYPDINQKNPGGDLTLAIITSNPDEPLEKFDREYFFLMDITDEDVRQYGGNPKGVWQLILKNDEERKNPYGRDGFFRTYDFLL